MTGEPELWLLLNSREVHFSRFELAEGSQLPPATETFAWNERGNFNLALAFFTHCGSNQKWVNFRPVLFGRELFLLLKQRFFLPMFLLLSAW